MTSTFKGLMTGVALAVFALPAFARDITIDLAGEPSSLDPHLQWNPDSYYDYRNVFDNVVTRNNAGEIVPQLATEWEQVSDTELVLTIRDDVTFHDGEPLEPSDVVYSVLRITNPDFASPQLGQFNQIIGAEVVDGNKVKLTTDGPYPALMAQLVKLSVVPEHVVEAVAMRRSTRPRWARALTRSKSGIAACRSHWRVMMPIGARPDPLTRPSSARFPMQPHGWLTFRQAPLILLSASMPMRARSWPRTPMSRFCLPRPSVWAMSV